MVKKKNKRSERERAIMKEKRVNGKQQSMWKNISDIKEPKINNKEKKQGNEC